METWDRTGVEGKYHSGFAFFSGEAFARVFTLGFEGARKHGLSIAREA
jgi:hypothetical protein